MGEEVTNPPVKSPKPWYYHIFVSMKVKKLTDRQTKETSKQSFKKNIKHGTNY